MTRTPYPGHGRVEAGFSLLEVVVALVLVGIIAVIAIASYANYASDQRALVATRTLASDLRVAQQEALTRRAVMDVVFSDADAACGNMPSYTLQVQTDSAVVKRACLAEDVGWTSLPSTATFETLGTRPAGAARIELRLQSTRTGKVYTVILEGQTGAVTCQPEKEMRCGG